MYSLKDINRVYIRPGTMDDNIVREIRQNQYHVKEYVRSGDVIVDIGAYIGAFALYVKECCPEALVFAVEPMPDNFAALLRNTAGVEGIASKQVALTGTPGSIVIYDFGSDASACHSIYALGVKGAKPVWVQGKTLEQLFEDTCVDHIRFLKLDCQGAEFDALSATPNRVLASIDYIAMEVHRAIAKTDVILGIVPDCEVKAVRLFRHLAITHVLIHGNLGNSIQVWANRHLVSWPVRLFFLIQIRHLACLVPCRRILSILRRLVKKISCWCGIKPTKVWHE